ncbi:hypothetical protein FKM82_020294 [Ascaphus truei]
MKQSLPLNLCLSLLICSNCCQRASLSVSVCSSLSKSDSVNVSLNEAVSCCLRQTLSFTPSLFVWSSLHRSSCLRLFSCRLFLNGDVSCCLGDSLSVSLILLLSQFLVGCGAVSLSQY